ncbi:MAG: T9SS type A sorting domain-containing protein [Bacteroidota bacterium]
MKKMMVLLIVLFVAQVGKGQSTANYAFTTGTTGSLAADLNSNAVDMTTGVTNLYGASVDSYTAVVQTLPFEFYFMGTRYTQFSVKPDGALQFGSTAITGHATSAVASTPLISLLGTDQKTATSGSVDYKTIGTTPNRTLIIQWKDLISYYSGTSNTNYCTYQLRLYETTGKIEFVYGQMYNNYSAIQNVSAFIASGASAGTVGCVKTISVTPTYDATVTSATTTAMSLNAAMTNLNSTTNGSRRYFLFSPGSVAAPTNLSFTSVGINVMTLNWTAASPITNVLKYAIYNSTDGTNYTYVNTVAVGANSYAANGLSSGVTYYWKVFSISEGGMSTALSGSKITNTCSTSGTKTIGATGNYASITSALTALTSSGLTGPVILELQTNYVAEGPITFGAIPCASATNTITIRPALGVSGTFTLTSAAASPTFNFNGGQYFIIDGRNGGSGSNKYITIVNSSLSGQAVQFINDGANNVIKYCTMQGVNNSASSGVVVFSTTTGSNGNDNNTIDFCDIKDGATTPYVAIYSTGSTTNSSTVNSGNTVSNCNIYNFFYSGSASYGFYISSGNSTWTISNNKIYQTVSRGSGAMYGIFFSDGTYGDNIQITGNTIGYNSNAASGTLTLSSGSFTGIYLFASSTASTACNINNNTISNVSLTSVTGAFYGIYNASSASTNTININGNTIKTIGLVTTSGIAYGVSWSSAATISISNNNIYDITRNAAGIIYGLYSNSASQTETISGNTIYNLTSTITTASSTIYGIYQSTSTTGNKIFQNNTIYNLTGNYGSPLCGIYMFMGATADISGNIIYGLTNSNGSAGTVYGINTGSSVSTANIYKNKIYGLSSSSTSTTVSGIITSSSTSNIYNNIIGGLAATAVSAVNPLIGINIFSGTTANLYYNTVYLNATSSGVNFGSSAVYASTTPTLNMRNNIFVNTSTAKGTGLTVAYRRSSTTLTSYASTSNNNLFWAGTLGSLNKIYYDGTTSYQTLANYKTLLGAGRDALSISENPTWVSTTGSVATFLHINTSAATQIEGGGASVATYTTDFDGQIRHATNPDIGADEFTGVSPLLVNLNSITASSCTAISHAVSVNCTTILGTITGVTISYNNGADAGPFAMTNTSGTTWTYTIPVASPANTYVRWSVTATNTAGLTYTYNGATYQDNPTFGYTALATATPSTVCAGSSTSLSVAVSGSNVTIGTGLLLTGATSQPTAFCNRYAGYRSQTIYSAAELISAGLSAGNITSISYNITTSGDAASNANFIVKIGTTALTALTTNFESTASYTTVYPSQTFTHTASGLQTINFSTPYTWDGVSNILIDVTHAGANLSNNATTYYTSTPGYSVLTATSIAATTGTQSSNRLDLVFSMASSPTAYSWSDGSTVVGATNPLTTTVSANKTYTCTSTVMGCPVISSGAAVTATSLTGTKTIGASGCDYPTIPAAIAALNGTCGVLGPVVFSLQDAIYNISPQTINQITGASATNTITFKPALGVSPVITITTTAVSQAGFKLDGSDYIIFDGSNTVGGTTKDLTIVMAGFYSDAFLLSNTSGTTNNTIKNCIITGFGNSDTYSTCIKSDGTGNNYNTFQNNTLTKASYGLFLNIFADISTGNKIKDNIIGSSGASNTYITSCGIFAKYQTSIEVSGNEIFNVINSTSAPYGIMLTSPCYDIIISKNKIHDIVYTGTGGYGGKGMYVWSGTANPNILISNNIIYHIAGDADGSANCPAGIRLEGSSITTGVYLYYNSIYLTSDATYGMSDVSYSDGFASGLEIVSGSGIDFRNNIIYNNLNSGTEPRYAIYCTPSTSPFSTISNNVYYVIGIGGSNNIGYGGAIKTTLANWQTWTGQDANSISGDPLFISTTNLHIQTAALTPTSNAGVQIAAVSDDVDGTARSNPPDIGADEFVSTASVITGAATVAAFSTTYGTPSTAQTFSVSGSGLTVNLIATAPSGFEVSSDGITYGSSATFSQTGGNASGSLRIRLAATAVVGGSYNSQNIVLSSTGATSVNITTASSGNIVNKAVLTITAANQTVSYGTAIATVTGAGTYTPTGFVNSETASVIGGTVTYTTTYTATTAAGTAGVTITPVLTSLTATNYSFSAATGTITIGKANSSITATGTISYTYTGLAQGPTTSTVTGSTGAVTYSYSGTGSTTYSASSTRPTLAGTYQVIATVAADANYNTAASSALAFTINKVVLTITAANQTVSYGTAIATVTGAGTYTPTGFVNSETASVIGGTVTYTTTYTATTAAGTAGVTITPVLTSLTATNYSFSAATGTITIGKANSSITATGTISYTYTGLAQGPTTSTVTGSTGAVTYSYSGTGSTTYSASSTRPTLAGTYQVIATVAADANYNTAASSALAFTINKVVLTITAANQTVSYGTAIATVTGAGTYTPTGFVNSETASVIGGTVTYTTTYTATTAAGTAGVTITPVLTSLTATNYSFSAATGTITIGKANSSITATGTISYTYTGLAQGPTTSTVTGSTGAVTYSYSGTGSTTYSASSTRPTLAGTYQVIATVAADANYNTAASSALAFTINKVVLTITAANQTVSYGTAIATVTGAGTYTPTGFVNSETASVIGGTVTYTTTYTATTAAGTAGVTITPVLTSLTATNYSFSAATGTITILPETPMFSGSTSVCASSAGNTATISNPLTGATYSWTITGGTITSGASATTVIYTAGANGVVILKATQSKDGYTSVEGTMTTITITPTSVGGTIATAQTICSGSSPTNLTLSGHTGVITKWQYATDAAFTTGVTDITNTTTTLTSVNMGALTADRWYRAVITSSPCALAYSNIIKITVNDPITPGTISSSQTICNGVIPAQFTGVTPTGGDGVFTYQWQKQINCTGAWLDIATNATSSNYQPEALTQNTCYRRKVTNTCGVAFSTPITDVNEIFHYIFVNQPGIIVQDYSGNNNQGTLSGATYASGLIGGACVFDGIDDYIEIGSRPEMRMASGGTITAWIYPGTSNNNRIIDKSTIATSADYHLFLAPTTNQLAFRAGGTTLTLSSNNAITLNAWNFVSVTFNSSGRKLYVNGVDVTLSGGNIITLPPAVDGAVRVGNRAGATDRTFDGSIDDLRIFNTVLSAGEVAQLYNTSLLKVTVLPVFTAGTIASTGQTICYNGDPSIISNNAVASGGNEVITYEWRAGSIPILNSNSATYDPPAGLTATTTFTRWAKDGTCNGEFIQSEGSWDVTVVPATIEPAFTSGPTSLCANSSSTYAATSTQGTITFSIIGGTGASINSITGTLISAGTANFIVRATSTNIPCGTLFTDRSVIVNAPPSAPTSVLCTTPICAGTTTTLTAVGGSFGDGGVYEWGKGAVGLNILLDATSSNYTTEQLVSNTTYWVRIKGNTSCTVATSGVTQLVTVQTAPIPIGLTTGDCFWTGAVNTIWNNPSNWLRFNGTQYTVSTSLPDVSSNVFIQFYGGTCATSNAITSANSTVFCHNMNIETGLTLGGLSSIDIQGNWNNSGTFIAGNGTVSFSGNTQQTINPGGSNFSNLIVNNAEGILLNSNLNINNALTMTTGNIIMGSYTLELGQDASNPGTLNYVSGSVQGKMKRWYAQSTNSGNTGLFPIGVGSDYRPLLVEFTDAPTGGGNLSVQFKEVAMGSQNSGNSPTISAINGCDEFLVTSYSSAGYWEVNPTGAGMSNAAYNITLIGGGFTGINTLCKTTAVKRVGSGLWITSGTHVPPTGSLTAPILQRVGAMGWSNWGIAGGGNNMLPLELIKFNAICQNIDVNLTWSTASEVNCQSFVVEKSFNGIQWNSIAELTGAGNSNHVVNYQYLDVNSEGIAYYRLKQTDFDGVNTYSEPIAVDCELSNNNQVIVYPNPFKNSISINGLQEVSSTFEITDVMGKIVYKDYRVASYTESINLGSLTPGLYTLIIIDINGKSRQFKIVKN